MPDTTNSSRSVIAKLASTSTGGLFSLDDAVDALGTPRAETSRKLSTLVRTGWITRIRRGVYAIRPLESLPGTPIATDDSWTVAMRVFAPCYIGGWTAAGHWGLTEQLFRSTLVVSRRPMRRSETTVGGNVYRVVKDRRTTTSGLKVVWRSNARVLVSDIERTLLDACAYPDWIAGGGMLASAFLAAVAENLVTPANLLRAARHAPSGAALGRLGVLIDRFLPAAEPARRFCAKNRGTGYVRFDPSIDRNGSLSTRWGVWLNVRLPEGSE